MTIVVPVVLLLPLLVGAVVVEGDQSWVQAVQVE